MSNIDLMRAFEDRLLDRIKREFGNDVRVLVGALWENFTNEVRIADSVSGTSFSICIDDLKSREQAYAYVDSILKQIRHVRKVKESPLPPSSVLNH